MQLEYSQDAQDLATTRENQHKEGLASSKEYESITKYIADFDILLRRLSEDAKALSLRRKLLLEDVNALISLYETSGDTLYYNNGRCIFLYENDKKEVVHSFVHTEGNNFDAQLSLFE